MTSEPQPDPALPPPLEDEGPAPWDFRDLAMLVGAALPALLVAAIVTVVVNKAVGELGEAREALLLQLCASLLWCGALYAIARFRHQRGFWDAVSWSGSVRDLLASLVIGPVLAVAVTLLAAASGMQDIETPMKRLLSDSSVLVLVALFATTLGPLVEELVFRGFLMPLFSRSFGDGAGIVLSAVPFALLHGPEYAWSWRHLLIILLAGIAFGWRRYVTGSTAAATALHATYNFTLLAGYVIEGDLLN